MAHLERWESPRSRPFQTRQTPGLATLLDVTLRRGDQFRQWRIRQRAVGWDCCVMNLTTMTVSGCDTLDQAIARRLAWESEIAAARADGWA